MAAIGNRPTRIDAFDSMRADMMLLVVVLHAGLCYGAAPPNPLWTLQDPDATGPIYVLVSLIYLFAMPVFYILAGFSFHSLVSQRGQKLAVVDRVQRVLMPFLLFITPVVFFSGLAFQIGINLYGQQEPRQYEWFQTYHLWFLYYLLMFYMLSLTLHTVVAKLAIIGTLAKRIPLLALPALFGTVMGFIAYINAPFSLESAGGFIPNANCMLFYGMFFICGECISNKRNDIRKLKSNTGALWLTTFLFTTFSILVFSATGNTTTSMGIVESSLLCISLYFLCFAIVSSYLRWSKLPSRFRAKMSDASYWIYLTHFPIVLWIFIGVVDSWLNVYIKFLVTIITSVMIGYFSYHHLIKKTFVGTMLHGKAINKATEIRAESLA